jgi:plastocyanin
MRTRTICAPALAAAALATTTAVAPAVAGDAHPAAAKPKTVLIGDAFFKPDGKLTIAKGTTVSFTWGKKGRGTEIEHNVTSKGKKGDKVRSGDRDKGTFKHKFEKTTLVICTIHPDSMRLKVTVK